VGIEPTHRGFADQDSHVLCLCLFVILYTLDSTIPLMFIGFTRWKSQVRILQRHHGINNLRHLLNSQDAKSATNFLPIELQNRSLSALVRSDESAHAGPLPGGLRPQQASSDRKSGKHIVVALSLIEWTCRPRP